jgi:biotin carboxyl carrier protein
VLLGWLVWRQTWFGVRLSDDDLAAAMAAEAKPRDVQHAVSEVVRRYDENASHMERWGELLLVASRRPEDAVRNTAAWALGDALRHDPTRTAYVERLRELVKSDPSVLVRRNAAPALAVVNDPTGREVLRSMLEPWVVAAPQAGRVVSIAAVDAALAENAPAARLAADAGDVEVRTPVPGRVLERRAEEGAAVAKDAPLLVLAADPDHAAQAALALRFVGTRDDLELLGVVAGPHVQARDDVKARAREAMDAIRARDR